MSDLPIPIDRCPRRYADMPPDGPRSRRCAQCETSVHDLSAMSRAEAARVLAGDEPVCVRYLFDRSGRVVHRRAGRLGRVVALAVVAAAPLLTEACGGAPRAYDYNATEAPEEPPATEDEEPPASVPSPR